jgi:deoxyhypusine synthase
MVQDPEVTVVGTFSGAMSVAKMGLMLCDMLDRGWLDIVITTGALVAHGFIENLGRAHYKYPQERSDRELYLQGYNRIYDTLEMEANLDYAEEVVREVLDRLDHGEIWASESLCRELGRHLAEHTDQPGLLRNAYLKGAPVYIPAFTDSELGLDLAGYMVRRALAAGESLPQALSSLSVKFNPFLDLGSYAQRVLQAKKLGIFTVGGGVPRNWAQQVAPTWNCCTAAWGLVCRRCGFNTGCASAPSRPIGGA